MPKAIHQIVQVITSQLDPISIYLFGSFATGKSRRNSDIDLCVVKNRVKNKMKALVDLRLKLWDIPYPMDIVLMTEKEFQKTSHLWWTLQGQIKENGKKIYEKIRG